MNRTITTATTLHLSCSKPEVAAEPSIEENRWLAADRIDWNDCELGACTCERALQRPSSDTRIQDGGRVESC